MKLDAKQKILLAIFTLYQKDMPDMNLVSPSLVGLDEYTFQSVLGKLVNEGLITGVSAVDLSEATITRDGIDYIQDKFQIDKLARGDEKLSALAAKSSGWGALKALITDTMEELRQTREGEAIRISLDEMIGDINRADRCEITLFEYQEGRVNTWQAFGVFEAQRNRQGKVFLGMEEEGYWVSDEHLITKTGDLDDDCKATYSISESAGGNRELIKLCVIRNENGGQTAGALKL